MLIEGPNAKLWTLPFLPLTPSALRELAPSLSLSLSVSLYVSLHVSLPTRHIFLFDLAVIVCKRRGDNYELKDVLYLNFYKITNNPTSDREGKKVSGQRQTQINPLVTTPVYPVLRRSAVPYRFFSLRSSCGYRAFITCCQTTPLTTLML